MKEMRDLAAAATLRVDKWLWYARFARTRSLAAKLCTLGCVAISGAPVLKPNHPVRIGDSLTVQQGRFRRRVTVRALGERRGGAAEARLLYAETMAPESLATREQAWVPLIDEESWEQV